MKKFSIWMDGYLSFCEWCGEDVEGLGEFFVGEGAGVLRGCKEFMEEHAAEIGTVADFC